MAVYQVTFEIRASDNYIPPNVVIQSQIESGLRSIYEYHGVSYQIKNVTHKKVK